MSDSSLWANAKRLAKQCRAGNAYVRLEGFRTESAAQEWAAEQSRLGRTVSRPWFDEVRKQWVVMYSGF